MRRIISLVLLLFATSANSSVLSTLGDISQIALPASAVITSLALHDDEGLIQFTHAYLTTMSCVYILKPIVNENRPNGGAWSFPSGHTASAMAGASYLGQRYGMTYGGPAFILAALVASSRVATNKHYSVDVIAGGAIGLTANLFLTTRWPNVSVKPLVNTEGVAIQSSISW